MTSAYRLGMVAGEEVVSEAAELTLKVAVAWSPK